MTSRLVLLSVKEYALYRRVSTRTVERWLSRHELPAERNPGKKGQWRIRVWRGLSDTQPANEAVFCSAGLCD
jgi:excisionase family DNA binding protein